MIVKLNDNSQLRRRVSRLTTGWVWLLLLPCVSNMSKDISLSLSRGIVLNWPPGTPVPCSAQLCSGVPSSSCSATCPAISPPKCHLKRLSIRKNVHIVCSRKAGGVLIFSETLLHSVPPTSPSLFLQKKKNSCR